MMKFFAIYCRVAFSLPFHNSHDLNKGNDVFVLNIVSCLYILAKNFNRPLTYHDLLNLKHPENIPLNRHTLQIRAVKTFTKLSA